MFKRSREKRNSSPTQSVDGVPHALAHGAERAVGRVARTAVRHQSGNVKLKEQLAKTSRDLAHESSDLHEAVNSLNAAIKANRKAAKRGRMRLLGGLVIGAAIMYHLDPQHGQERRTLAARQFARLTCGKSAPPEGQPGADGPAATTMPGGPPLADVSAEKAMPNSPLDG